MDSIECVPNSAVREFLKRTDFIRFNVYPELSGAGPKS